MQLFTYTLDFEFIYRFHWLKMSFIQRGYDAISTSDVIDCINIDIINAVIYTIYTIYIQLKYILILFLLLSKRFGWPTS